MKLQFDEIVDHADADHVLRKLEQYFLEVSLETVRTDHQLIVYGLGPSFRTMNPKDKTIVRATPQPAATMLHTEADFLASALMGDVAQDDIVRSKIERVFESLKAELHSGTASPGPDTRTLQTDETVSTPPADAAVPILANIAEVRPPAPVEVEQISPPPIDPAPDFTKLTSVEPKPELKPEPEPQPKRDEPVLPAAPRPASVPRTAKVEAAPLKKKRSAILWLLPILILLVVAAGYFLQHSRLPQVQSAATPAAPTASPTAETKTAAPAQPSPSLAASAEATPPAMPTDVKAWVQAWAVAMRTRDVQYQLSFYATPLDRYFLTPQVGREQLLKDKQADIDNRKGVWTFKAEDVVVDKKTATNAVVMLIKHITVELPSSTPSSTIQEQLIKTQLKLKMVDGGWKITSERIIG